MKTEEEINRILKRPLPAEAIKKHPSKSYLSTIIPIYFTERLNEAFGVGEWQNDVEDLGFTQETSDKGRTTFTAKVRVTLTLPNGKHCQCIATSDNDDEGDAYKGATSDCISKICSWLGIGAHVWKNQTQEQAWAEYDAIIQRPKAEKAKEFIFNRMKDLPLESLKAFAQMPMQTDAEIIEAAYFMNKELRKVGIIQI